MTTKAKVVANPTVVVEVVALKKALQRFNDWQGMCLEVGAGRVPDETDRIHLPILYGDVPTNEWYIHSINCNAGGVIGVISVTLAGPVAPSVVRLEYTTYTEKLRHLPL